MRPIEPVPITATLLAGLRCRTRRPRAPRRPGAPPWPPAGRSRPRAMREHVLRHDARRDAARTARRPRSRRGGRRTGSRARPRQKRQLPQGAELATTTRAPGARSRTPSPDRLHHPRHLVAEHGGRGEHARVIAAAEDLHVGAAGEGGLVAQHDLARARLGHRRGLRCARLPCRGAPPRAWWRSSARLISTTTLSTPGAGRAAVSMARADSSRGNRWVTRLRTSICRSKTRRAARSWMSAEEL